MRNPRGFASLLATLLFVFALGSCADTSGPLEPSQENEPYLGLLSSEDDGEDGDGLLLEDEEEDDEEEKEQEEQEDLEDGESLLSPVPVLRRSEALDEEESVSKTVTSEGAVIELEDAGLRLYIPPDAVSEPTLITIVAPKGDLVGYHFSPHGLHFDRPAVLVQELEDTEADDFPEVLQELVGAYFEGDLLSEIDPLELLNVQVFEDDDEDVAAFPIHHFSGYVIATN